MDISKRVSTQHHEVRDAAFSKYSSGILLPDGPCANNCRGTEGINGRHADIVHQASCNPGIKGPCYCSAAL
jgi:hypothetical protein